MKKRQTLEILAVAHTEVLMAVLPADDGKGKKAKKKRRKRREEAD